MTTADQRVHDEHGPFTYRDARRLLILMVIVIAGWLLLRALVPVLLLFGIVILLAMVLNDRTILRLRTAAGCASP